ncbi:MAG: GDSL-type esterase/lipase family protein [Candidatus Symbiothrix sp.]|jgi:lysophospholipase L1-like esterase|nr:GDSL-type esterase/lipase family protein [Candidatus Symbiothrix sp.]
MKRFLLLLALLTGFYFRFTARENAAVPEKVDLPVYGFIDYSMNKIQIPGDSSRIRSFYQKVGRLLNDGEGQINILHIGGSHIQADIFSHQVRRNLEAINSRFQTPRGFIFPFSVAKTNNPANYKVTYTGKWANVKNVQYNREISVGVGGIAVYTNDPEASIRVTLNTEEYSGRWRFDRLRLLGYTEEESETGTVEPVLYNGDLPLKASFDFISNSYLFELPESADSFRVAFIQKDTVPHTFILTGFIPEKETPGIVYHAIGVNGASVPSYLSSEFFEDELPLIMPDLVVFEIGVNDASGSGFKVNSFIQNYNLLIERIKHVLPDCAFIFITNNDTFKRIKKRTYRVNSNGLIAKEAFFKIAEENQGGVWDLFSIMGGMKSMQTWQANGLAQADKIHFTRTGYELLGDLFYNALIDLYLQINIE